ncbi:Transcription factor TFIIIB component B'' [Astathelohania contejeani]|uniref:Transcription factor TFIIIB component B n=1 Tax=Astathelohania contejeani TaxID=164912 RepID=A0ABQ7HXD8_9MICR|nr:Transcription factor TFIIIB component B'' [Thelohania contejeani]
MDDLKLSHFLNNSNYKIERKKKPKKKVMVTIDTEKKDDMLMIKDDKIVLDETKLYLKKDRVTNMEIFDEEDQIVTSMTYKKKVANKKWSALETEMFYKGLEICGTEFSLLEGLLIGKTRKQIKNKFLREEKINKEKIDQILKSQRKFNIEEYNRLKNELANRMKCK